MNVLVVLLVMGRYSLVNKLLLPPELPQHVFYCKQKKQTFNSKIQEEIQARERIINSTNDFSLGGREQR